MINHLRTLLLNLNGGTNLPGYDYPGEEYVPSDFRPVSLPVAERSVRAALFGGGPDRAFLNVRALQLLTLVHASDLADHALKHDTRLTYWPADGQVHELLTDGVTVTPSGTAGTNLELSGLTVGRSHPNQLLHRWSVEVVDGSTVRVVRTAPYADVDVVTYTTSGGWSDLHPLGDLTDLHFRFESGVGGRWELECLHRPLYGLDVAVDELETTRSRHLDDVFGSAQGDYGLYRELWQDPTQPLAHRLGAVVLALGDRLHAAWGGPVRTVTRPGVPPDDDDTIGGGYYSNRYWASRYWTTRYFA